MMQESGKNIRALAQGIKEGEGGRKPTAAGAPGRPRFGVKITLRYHEADRSLATISYLVPDLFVSELAAHLWRHKVIDGCMQADDRFKPSTRELSEGERFDLCYIAEGEGTIHARFQIIEYVDYRPGFPYGLN